MKKWIHIFNRFYDLLGLAFLSGLIICCWLQVIARFMNNVTIVWTDELAGYMGREAILAPIFFGIA